MIRTLLDVGSGLLQAAVSILALGLLWVAVGHGYSGWWVWLIFSFATFTAPAWCRFPPSKELERSEELCRDAEPSPFDSEEVQS